MVTLTFPHTDEDVEYWRAAAEEAHAWKMLCHEVWLANYRRRKELGLRFDWSYLDEIQKAQAVFSVHYHVALAQCESARYHLTSADLSS